MIKYVTGLFVFLFAVACMELQPRSLSPKSMSMAELDEKVLEKEKNGTVLEDFETNVKGWFGCGEVEIENNSGALKASFNDARFACIGGKLKINDLSDIPVIQVRLKAESETFNEPLTLVLRMEDFDGDETNYDEQFYTIDVNKDYIDLELDYTGKLLSVNGDFDDQGIFKMKIFFNTKGSSSFSGTVWVDEIRAKSKKKEMY